MLDRRLAPLGAIALLSLVAPGFGATATGTVTDSVGKPLPWAVVTVSDGSPLPWARTLTDASGNYSISWPSFDAVRQRAAVGGWGSVELERPGEVVVRVRKLDGSTVRTRRFQAQAGTWRLSNPVQALQGLPRGTWIVEMEGGGVRRSTTAVQTGDRAGELALVPGTAPASARGLGTSGSLTLRIRNQGHLAASYGVSIDTTISVQLVRDPVESRIDSVMAKMTQAEKIGQMTQGVMGGTQTTPTYPAVAANLLGSVLSGGGNPLPDYDNLQTLAMGTPRKIPVIYGIDAVHGYGKKSGAVIHPHNIGLGASRDTALARQLGAMTAKEMWAGSADWAFAPCLAVARDIRWGRTYESYGESPELSVSMGSSYIRGLQGGGFDSAFRVVACAKHFMADGGTDTGTGNKGSLLDEGDSRIDDAERDSLHFPPYEAAVEAGVGTVMASYSCINGAKMHGNRALLSDSLKRDLGFDGFVVSDWLAIEQLPGSYSEQVAATVNAGVDMGMEPDADGTFETTLASLVSAGTVTPARIDDAVRRILRVKFRLGTMDNHARRKTWDSELGSDAHRALARLAVRKSLVLLKDLLRVLPLSKTGGTVAVWGSHADDAGLQCGGWTLSWQGQSGAVPGATTIYQGMQLVAGTARVKKVTAAGSGYDAAVVVAGEQPYAEMNGDTRDPSLATIEPSAVTAISGFASAGVPVVLVIVSGRPLVIDPATLSKTQAVLAAWLPGTEGAGVADILFGDYSPTGRLSFSWPRTVSQLPLHAGDAGADPLYPYGYGLRWW